MLGVLDLQCIRPPNFHPVTNPCEQLGTDVFGYCITETGYTGCVKNVGPAVVKECGSMFRPAGTFCLTFSLDLLNSHFVF